MEKEFEKARDYEDIGTVMSNFDHKINEGTEKKLKSGNFRGSYPAMGFYGTVWFDKKSKEFKCGIMQYHVRKEILSAPSLEEIMDIASEKYGNE